MFGKQSFRVIKKYDFDGLQVEQIEKKGIDNSGNHEKILKPFHTETSNLLLPTVQCPVCAISLKFIKCSSEKVLKCQNVSFKTHLITSMLNKMTIRLPLQLSERDKEITDKAIKDTVGENSFQLLMINKLEMRLDFLMLEQSKLFEM